MPPKSETRAGKARGSRNSCGCWFRDPLTPLEVQRQFLVTTHNVRPALAAIVAALAFGGHGHG